MEKKKIERPGERIQTRDRTLLASTRFRKLKINGTQNTDSKNGRLLRSSDACQKTLDLLISAHANFLVCGDSASKT